MTDGQRSSSAPEATLPIDLLRSTSRDLYSALGPYAARTRYISCQRMGGGLARLRCASFGLGRLTAWRTCCLLLMRSGGEYEGARPHHRAAPILQIGAHLHDSRK